jgi:outer membrane protein assembly factor BamD (BamD/ComL family)
MNLRPELLLLSGLLVACASQDDAHRPAARYETDPSRRPVVEAVLRQADRQVAAGEQRAALASLELLITGEAGTEGEAQALLRKARLLADRQQYDPAAEILDDLYARHSAFGSFQEVVALQFRIANELADGKRRLLGGWFPWFQDRAHAIGLYEKAVKLAPNGPLADESLVRAGRVALAMDMESRAAEILERLLSDYPASKHLPEALERLAELRAKESLGPDWDQAAALEAADHWRTLADQFPRDPRAARAAKEVAALRDRAARARLHLAVFYWEHRNNPEAAKLMANACRTIAPESAAAKEAEALLALIQKNPTPPATLADRLLGRYPRPRVDGGGKPTAVGEDLDALGFRKDVPKPATETERR